ncbi:zf-HC2 domain-containing protein [Sulfitobacter sp.]|uniref:anti-sigma factor family protein n=1 Tax=Sulfitobacter sp. TaxID=1903071 RepID=UPI003297468D
MSQTQNRKTARPIAGMMFRLPFMIDCEEFDRFILDYLEGNLSRGQRIKFEIHLKLCRECRDYLQAYKDTMELTKTQTDIPFSEMGMGDVPEDLIKAVLAARK